MFEDVPDKKKSSSNLYYLMLVAAVVTITGLACSLPFLQDGPDPDAEKTAVAQTISASERIQTGTALAQEDRNQAPTDTPEPTSPATLTKTPRPTLTPTQATPKAHISENTNCRFGPGEVYERSGIASAGQTLEVFGVDPGGNFWFVSHPGKSDQKCWIWNKYVPPEGPTDQLPVYTPRPTPTRRPTATPVVSFNVSYYEIESCVVDNILEFKITNTGDEPLESVSYNLTDQTSGLSKNDQYNSFQKWNHCPAGSPSANIMPGQSNYFVGFGVNVSTSSDALHGHTFQGTITACTKDNLGGKCVTRNVNFTAQ